MPCQHGVTNHTHAVHREPSIDGDGFEDADNDKDDQTDEDIGNDNTADGASGIIGIDDDGLSFPLWYGNGHDLILESARVDGCHRPPVALNRKFILCFP